MIRKVLFAVTGLVLIYTLCVGLACVPGLLLLPKEKTTTVDGITKLEEAVCACMVSGTTGWDLVEYAQKLTAKKFTYSRRNSWESPEKAFARTPNSADRAIYLVKNVQKVRSFNMMEYNNQQAEDCHCKKTDCLRWGQCDICCEYHYSKGKKPFCERKRFLKKHWTSKPSADRSN